MSRLVFGVHPVRELLRKEPRAVQTLWIAEGSSRPGGPSASGPGRARGALGRVLGDPSLPELEIEPLSASHEQLSALCGDVNHQGIVAVVGDFSYVALEDLVEGLADPLILAVDGVTDPQNLGAMIRSAVVLGATGAILTVDRCAAITPAVVRVSSGASEHLPCAQVTNLVRALDSLKKRGVWVMGTVESGGIAPAEADLRGPVVLVMGSEQRGMRRLVGEACDVLLTIPTPGPIAALNVASATTAVFYEACRQRLAR